jgi:hypothetical protein
MHDLSVEQVRAYSSSRITATFTHSRTKVGECVSMDFITGLPKVHGRDCIYVVVDRLTKFAHFFAISSEYKAPQVAELFFREVFRLHGLPKYIVSDRDNRFLSAFWQELFRLAGTELTPSTSYHPQTDGQTEIVNKWVEGYLRNYVSGQQKAWIKWLHLGEHCYNTTYHMSIGMTPFEHCMAMMLLHLWIWRLGIAGLPKPRIGYRRVKISLRLSRITCRFPRTNRRCMQTDTGWSTVLR